jgi:phosphate transport system substrate-binding protein
VGERTPDISNASRAIKESEIELCAKNGVSAITEIMIGYDGIVLANDKRQPRMNLSIEQIFLALAKEVPVDGKLIQNPYKTWHDIHPSLPQNDIAVYGPPPTSGTRDAFVEIVMERGCGLFPEYKAAYPDKDTHAKACHNLREDGGFIDAGENDNLIVQKLKSNPKALGIFGYSFLEENAATVQASLIENITPTLINISAGTYPVARSLFVYVKNAHVGEIAGLAEFLTELASESALSDEGYLADKGLIPMPSALLVDVIEEVEKLTATN